MNKLINKDNEWIIHFMGSLDRLLDISAVRSGFSGSTGTDTICPLMLANSSGRLNCSVYF